MKVTYIVFLLGVNILVACSGNPIKENNFCPSGRTLLDGVCVREEVVDYVSCVRARGAELGAEASKSLSAEVGYIGIKSSGAYEVSETLEKKYSTSNTEMMAIIKQCNDVVFSTNLNIKNNQGTSVKNVSFLSKLNKDNISGEWDFSLIANSSVDSSGRKK